jgi:hypothetical protein
VSARITCLFCKGTGSANNPPAFHDAGNTPEVSINCGVCKGEGYTEVDSPAGIRGTVLVARKIKNAYPQFQAWQDIYCFIVANISNAIDFSVASAKWSQQPEGDLTFEDDTVFSEDALPVDAFLEKWIEKGNYMEEAKTILGIKD